VFLKATIEETAEKNLKSRMTKSRKCNREPEEKEKFSQKFGTTFRIEFQNKNPEKLLDDISIITNPDGKVLFAEYNYMIPETEEFTSVDITEKQLKSIMSSLKIINYNWMTLIR